jgi:hypothetical protein
MRRLWLLALAVAACSGGGVNMGPAIDISQVSKSCSVATDCVSVTLHPCGCGCPEAAIASSDKAKYQAAKNAIVCTAPITCQADCVAPTTVCTAGTCALAL